MRAHNVCCSILLCSGLVLCAGHGTARAQLASEKAAADELFTAGKRLIEQGDYAAACDKFAASVAKVAQLGTQLALARCYEKLGKTASAWGAYRTAAIAAGKARDKRQRFAEERATVLARQLSKLVITLDAVHRVDGLEIRRDGALVTPAELDTPVPVDPGEHTIEARAPGHAPWSAKVAVPSEPGVVDASVPALEKLPDPAAARRRRHLVAYGIGGGGIAIVGASLIVGAVARSRWNAAQANCFEHMCNAAGFDQARSATTLANTSTVIFVVGMGAVAAGAYLLLTAPSASPEHARSTAPTALRLSPALGPTHVGLAIHGGF